MRLVTRNRFVIPKHVSWRPIGNQLACLEDTRAVGNVLKIAEVIGHSDHGFCAACPLNQQRDELALPGRAVLANSESAPGMLWR